MTEIQYLLVWLGLGLTSNIVLTAGIMCEFRRDRGYVTPNKIVSEFFRAFWIMLFGPLPLLALACCWIGLKVEEFEFWNKRIFVKKSR